VGNNLPPAENDFRQFPAGALYPLCLPAGYTLVSGSSSRRMDYLTGINLAVQAMNRQPDLFQPERTTATLTVTLPPGELRFFTFADLKA
jgi:hypothetical protein